MTGRLTLFDPVRLGDLALANRIVMAPMTRNRAGPGDVPTPDMVEYYRQRAGAGLIVTEGVHPSPSGKGYHRTPGIHTSAQVEGWRRVAEAVHERGGKIVMQLMHCGRAALAANQDPGAEVIAPSAVRCRADLFGPDGRLAACSVPRALSLDEISGVVDDYRRATASAMAAGFDGVELHATSGYLPMQFLSSNSNLRQDAYGGGATRRARFVIEVLEALAVEAGAGRTGLRIYPGSPYNDMADARPSETYAKLLLGLQASGLAYVHLIDRPTLRLHALPLVRYYWGGAVIANDGLSFDRAAALVEAGDAQAVSFGRDFIANPDLVERFRAGARLTDADPTTFYVGEARGYTDYPDLTGHRA